jgi:hypothetical protein
MSSVSDHLRPNCGYFLRLDSVGVISPKLQAAFGQEGLLSCSIVGGGGLKLAYLRPCREQSSYMWAAMSSRRHSHIAEHI